MITIFCERYDDMFFKITSLVIYNISGSRQKMTAELNRILFLR